MKYKLIIMSLLVFLLIGLSTSSFFLNEYLTKRIIENEHSITQLNFAIEQENLTALNFAWKKAPLYSEQWLTLAKMLAKREGEAAYQLALYYHFKSKQAVFWYKSAIRLNYLKASTGLAQLYFQQGELIKAAEVLDSLPIELFEKLSDEAIIIKVKIAINLGEIVDAQRIISKYVQQLESSKEGLLLLGDIQKYQIQLNDNKIIASSLVGLSCDNSIQLFATNLNHLKRLDEIILDFKKQALNNFVCFSPVRYMPINALNCSNKQDVAIRCDESNWQSWASTINARYVGIMLPQGGANVHYGVLYFDAKDTVDILAHEISHLLGFVDEYPLAVEHVKCQAIQKTLFSKNISVLKKHYQGNQKDIRANLLKQLAWGKYIKRSTPILQSVTSINGEHYWQLGSPEEFKHEVGVFNAQTCNNSTYSSKNDFSAFKAVSYRTKLQYFALDFPKLYSTLLQENSKQYSMPSFHYNIALAHFQQGSAQASYWLEKAVTWEQDVKRKKMVRQGKF